MRSMGIDPAKKCARDMGRLEPGTWVAERAGVSRRARGPVRSMGIDAAKKCVPDLLAASVLWMLRERAV
jgi:hypothetical protein